MVFIYLIYGLTFFLLGGVILIQAGTPFRVFPKQSILFLASFCILHGTHEWIELAQKLQSFSEHQQWLHGIEIALAFSSFFSLLFFGIDSLVRMGCWPCRYRYLLVVVPLCCILMIVLTYRQEPSLDVVDVSIRYLLALPGASIAAGAVLFAGKQLKPTLPGYIRYFFTSSAVFFLFYALFAGAIVPSASFFPASLLNTEIFIKLFGFPVVVVRAICALGIAVSLAQIFTISVSAQTIRAQLREEFIAIIAHDMRSPLTLITLNTGLLVDIMKENKGFEQLPNIVDDLKISTKNLNTMITDLLDAALLETEKMPIQLKYTDFYSLLEGILDRTESLVQTHKIHRILSKNSSRVNVDQQRIEQVLTNLISNAVKYSFPSSEIVIESQITNKEAIVSVTNSGPEIPKEDLPSLFERFFRGSAKKGTAPGLGLGLYIVRGIITAHGGRTWVESEPGKLTTFGFSLPLA